MLPYSPLHHLLLADAGVRARADERQRQRRADRLPRRRRARAPRRRSPTRSCVHDRPIHTRTDDSVVRVVRGRPTVLRRSRGLRARRAARCRSPAPRPVLACGAELKSTFCVAKGARAWVGHHIGDLANAETLRVLPRGHRALRAALRRRARRSSRTTCTPTTSRPPTRSSARASSSSASSTTTRTSPRAWPSTARPGPRSARSSTAPGYGTDGTVWGGEILVGDLRGVRARRPPAAGARCPAATAPRASRGGWRAPGCVAAGAAPALPARAARARRRRSAGTRSRGWRATGFAAPVTTSMGRLFDAVAALCGVRAGRRPTRARRRSSSRRSPTRGERGAYALGADLDARPLVARGRSPTLARGRRRRGRRRRASTARSRRATAAACARRRAAPGSTASCSPAASSRTACCSTRPRTRLEARGPARARPRAPAGQRRRHRLRPGGGRRGGGAS